MKKFLAIILAALMLTTVAFAQEAAMTPDELFEIGDRYYDGVEVAQDYEKAFGYFKLAAEQGHLESINRLAICYDNGRGVEQDQVKAVELYTQAAEQGYAKAQYNLGLSCYSGEGIEQSYEKAYE